MFCPAEMVEPLGDLITAAERLERAAYRYELVPLAPGDRVEVGRGLTMEASPQTTWSLLGFHLWRARRRLAPAYAGLPAERADRLAAARDGHGGGGRGHLAVLLRRYRAGPLRPEPRLFDSRVLMLECTFLGDEQKDKGRLFKHLHLEDIALRAARFPERGHRPASSVAPLPAEELRERWSGVCRS